MSTASNSVRHNGRKLAYVELKFDNGDVQILTGDDANDWLRDLNGMIMLSSVHGHKLGDHPWKKFAGTPSPSSSPSSNESSPNPSPESPLWYRQPSRNLGPEEHDN